MSQLNVILEFLNLEKDEFVKMDKNKLIKRINEKSNCFGEFSRYFSLDAWWEKRIKMLPENVQKIFPFIIDNLNSKAYNTEKNITEVIIWEALKVAEKNGLISKDIFVNSVEKNLATTKATEHIAINSVQKNAQLNIDLQSQNQNVKYVEKKQDCIEISIAQKLVQIKQDMETLIQVMNTKIKDKRLEDKHGNQIHFNRKDVNYAIALIKYYQDIIQTTQSQMRLYGYAENVITKQMQQDLNPDQLWKNFKHLPDNIKKTHPFWICSKASKSEKNKGCEGLEKKFTKTMNDGIGAREHNKNEPTAYNKNHHPCVKPLKIISYLLTMFTRKEDIVLDLYAGSGSLGVSAYALNRQFIMFELNEDYYNIAKVRIDRAMEKNYIF